MPLIALALAVFVGWVLWKDHVKRRVAAVAIDEVEARHVLGLGLDAGRAEILAAHRAAIARHHPDRGGDPEQARRVNAARDRLLAGLARHG